MAINFLYPCSATTNLGNVIISTISPFCNAAPSKYVPAAGEKAINYFESQLQPTVDAIKNELFQILYFVIFVILVLIILPLFLLLVWTGFLLHIPNRYIVLGFVFVLILFAIVGYIVYSTISTAINNVIGTAVNNLSNNALNTTQLLKILNGAAMQYLTATGTPVL